MDNKATTKRMIGAVVLVLIAALLLAWLLKGKNRSIEQRDLIAEQTQGAAPILGFPGVQQDTGTTLASNQGQLVPSTNSNQEAPIGIDTGAAAGQRAGTTTTADGVTTGTIIGQDAAQASNKNTKDFSVRDTSGREVRPVVENGKPAVGVGSMGANEIASTAKTGSKAAPTPAAAPEQQVPIGAAKQPEATSSIADSNSTTTQPLPIPPPAPAASTTTTRASTEAVVPTPAPIAVSQGTTTRTETRTTVSTASTNRDRPAAQNEDEVRPNRTIPSPRLVNERPVPAPTAQPRVTTRPAAPAAPRPAPVATTRPAAPVAAARPAPAPEPADRGGYVVQLLATSNKAKADEIRRAMSGDGYPVFIAQANVDGKPVYRVRVGSYPGKGDAAAIQSRMKSRYGQNQYVQSSFVTRN